MIRIRYMDGTTAKTVTVEGSTMGDAVSWMNQQAPGVVFFRASIKRGPAIGFQRGVSSCAMVAADETETGAHRPVRRA